MTGNDWLAIVLALLATALIVSTVFWIRTEARWNRMAHAQMRQLIDILESLQSEPEPEHEGGREGAPLIVGQARKCDGGPAIDVDADALTARCPGCGITITTIMDAPVVRPHLLGSDGSVIFLPWLMAEHEPESGAQWSAGGVSEPEPEP